MVDIVITEAFYWTSRSTSSLCKQFRKTIKGIFSGRGYNVGGKRCLKAGLKCYFPKESGCLFTHSPMDGKVVATNRLLKEKPKDVSSNCTSILTTLNESDRKCDAVLTGDSTAELILPLVKGKEVKIFQVQHHGASSNSSCSKNDQKKY